MSEDLQDNEALEESLPDGEEVSVGDEISAGEATSDGEGFEIPPENEEQTPAPEEVTEQAGGEVPVGIARLRDEWLKLGLKPSEQPRETRVGLEPVIFPEPVGDYRIPFEEARTRLGLSAESMERLLAGGEVDSILVRADGGTKRMVSQASLDRFIEDSGMERITAEKEIMSSPEVMAVIQSLQEQITDLRELHSRQLQQFKDILLLELRNLKEQDRDLTSFIYDLTAGLEEVFPKLKKRKRTTPPGK